MLHSVLVTLHLFGLILMGGGLLAVFVADLRGRQATALPVFAETVRLVALSYDGLVVPGALLLAGSGTWLVVEFHGWDFLTQPWLVGMIGLFLFEFIEGNTVTRLYFMALRREARRSEAQGAPTPELAALREKAAPAFTHFLDLPMVFLIVTLGVLKPQTWTVFLSGGALAVTVATVLTLLLHGLHRRVGGLDAQKL